jgi:hypothetical protein
LVGGTLNPAPLVSAPTNDRGGLAERKKKEKNSWKEQNNSPCLTWVGLLIDGTYELLTG